MINILTLGDSYKYSHSTQYPKNTVSMYSYMESRGGVYPATVFVGLQGLIQDYLMTAPTPKQVNDAQAQATAHGVPFDREGWDHIAALGYLPIRIKAIKEGSLIPVKHVMLTVESTDQKVPWIAGFVETLLLKLWYPITVATKSYYVKQMLMKYGSPEWAQFAYHNFGDRGATSVESAAIGGFAHLTQFMGTDNFNALTYCKDHYDTDMAGYSVFATEHSTTTSWGKENEEEFVYQQLLNNPDAPIMSFVADSYDVYNFTDFCTRPGSRIRELVESRPHQKFVFRPDSGNAITVIGKMLAIMLKNEIAVIPKDQGAFKRTFKDYGILWGDGITPETIKQILRAFTTKEMDGLPLFAAENFVFGSGGDLMQNMTRDTQKFAIKCSSITTKTKFDESMGQDRSILKDIDVYKDPITDPGKTSKRGKVTTYRSTMSGESKSFDGVCLVDKIPGYCVDALETVFLDGKLVRTTTLEEIRNAN